MPPNRTLVEDLLRRLQAALPGDAESADALREDIRANATEALAGLLARMELVTREEFEVQAALLDEAYRRLEALEAQLPSTEGDTEPGP